MLLDFEDIARMVQQAERRVGFLEFACDALGLFEGVNASLEGPIRTQVMERAGGEQRANPGVFTQILGAFTGDIGQGAARAHASENAKLYWENTKILLAQSGFRRSLADLNDREMAVLRASCVHSLAQQDNSDTHDEFLHFFTTLNAKLVWAGGRGQFMPSEQADRFPSEAHAAFDIARELMRRTINDGPASYEQELAEMLSQYVQVSQFTDAPAHVQKSVAAIAQVLDPSAAGWMTADHIASGQTPFKGYEAGPDLLIGALPAGNGNVYYIGYDGAESLVTVAQPGAGKTQAHVIPNLIAYDGAIVALDPKLELLELTAGYRQAAGKRILVLNLADDDQPTHRFNVMEFVDTRPDFLWGAVIELAEFLIPEARGDNNPIFRAKASEMFAVCLGGVILEAQEKGEVPTLTAAIAKVFSAIETLRSFFYDTQDRAEEYGCAPLAQSAGSLAALARNPDTLEDFQRYQSNATSALMKYRGGLIDRVAGGVGDWKPEELRVAGTTLYIRIPYEEMAVYGGFVRMVLYTLIKRLRKGRTEQGELPITFLLDEVAQLGDLDQIANVVETGRGFGLRVWMVLQDYDQARAASRKPNLILKTPRIRLFMNPSLETAQDMSAELGKINQILTGQDKPMAEPAQLMGAGFTDDVVVLSSGAYPLRLKKYLAYRDDDYSEVTGAHYQFTQDGFPMFGLRFE